MRSDIRDGRWYHKSGIGNDETGQDLRVIERYVFSNRQKNKVTMEYLGRWVSSGLCTW